MHTVFERELPPYLDSANVSEDQAAEGTVVHRAGQR